MHWELFSPFLAEFGVTIFHDTLWDLDPDPKWYRPDMGVPRLVEDLRKEDIPCSLSIKTRGQHPSGS